MGIESLQPKRTFGLEELGLLDTAPLKSVDTIVDLCAQALHTPLVALLMFDDRAASLVVRSIMGHASVQPSCLNMPAAKSACGMVREKNGPIGISDLGLRPDTRDAVERRKLGASGFLGAPVLCPAGKIVGVLAAMTAVEHHWTHFERNLMARYALLMSEQILLRAALKTVKLMANERDKVEPVARPRN